MEFEAEGRGALGDSCRCIARGNNRHNAEVVEAFQLCSRTEGIIPALESAHALAWIAKMRDEVAGTTILVNMSGRGDKDVNQMMDVLGS